MGREAEDWDLSLPTGRVGGVTRGPAYETKNKTQKLKITTNQTELLTKKTLRQCKDRRIGTGEKKMS